MTILAPPHTTPTAPPDQAMTLARRIADLELTGDRAQHRVRIDLENLLREPGSNGVQAVLDAAELVYVARVEQAGAGLRPMPYPLVTTRTEAAQ
ncbi:hypothetical protein ACFYY8_33815 [Streptosporangium sp. NPDC001559]|uniref:hypothetical protein n=1 Tax=Streptosporangium sp. NPDC001559 TaxID=3366187 RepID=UPI0036E36D50